MFKPKLLTNQVKVTLFLGMALILLPLFLPIARAAEVDTRPAPKAQVKKGHTMPRPKTPVGGDVAPAPASSPTPPVVAPKKDGDSGSVSNDGDTAIAANAPFDYSKDIAA
jgi:hypothetical protein